MAETRYQVPTTGIETYLTHPILEYEHRHSGRLKYASPRDLPSFPSPGLPPDGAAAGAAASLGWANQKSIQLWKPEKSNSASTAAMLAKDYKMPPTWEPNSSSAGAKAALVASASARKQAASQMTPQSAHGSWGSSAANQAFKQSRAVKQPAHKTSTGGLGSLLAAQSAMPATARTRPRAKSTPVPKESYPGESRAAANALSAATAAHDPSTKPKSPTDTAGSVPYTNLPRKMFTSSPAIGPEADEQKRADMLHASAVAMARQMYSHQQKMVDQARQAQQDSGEAVSDDNQPKPYVNLQEAAYKLAQERLSKLHEEHQRNRDYQEYYGNGKPPQPQRRFTMKGKLRRRSSSDGDINDDREQSERIRRQMSIFSSNLTKVDEQKRTKDREALLAAAQRNVRARLQGMDDKISAETGMVPPSSKSDWEAKAQMAALARHESANVNRGKIDIGGGMFMDPAAVDEIATRRVQPVLDEINEKAAIERERQELLKAEAEAKKRDEAKQKERDREIKELNRKVMEQEKQEEKERRHREKKELKAKKDEEKAARAEEKRKSKGPETLPDESPAAGESSETSPTVDGPGTSVSRRASQGKPTVNTQREASNSDNPRSPSESGSPTNKMKEWLKSRFSRPRGRSSAGENAEDRGFVGGVALTRLANESATSLDGRSASMREVAIAGKTRVEVSNSSAGYEDSGHKARNSRDVSPVSSDSESEHFVEARDDLEGPVSPPVPIRDPGLHKSSSPTRDSRFREIIE
ncbi:hypothetical protein CH63R_04400 [Colletotrichum higginsianum IMI 349063]|uniref:Eisosome protein 1 n=1 Tax=Colletotrichum higginsianum (strain IMI 349063) TaxID=759273 RepID=A0A1B7YJN0_COLHI|nr:hypothetical protein CH63R_04400 [Colletotrichum higginsianum IMI 349063]OBR12104.1 hypothetical protein CH63R_04400 [Colletotrichum higginsianum IMI 349063]